MNERFVDLGPPVVLVEPPIIDVTPTIIEIDPDVAPDEAVTAAADVMTGAMIAFVPRVEDAQRLAIDGYEPAEQLHCTSVYLGDAVDFDDETRGVIIGELTELASELEAVVANVFGFAILNPMGDEPCLGANVGGADLWEAQEQVCGIGEQYASPDQHWPWLAHVTLGYTDDPRTLLTDDVLGRVGPILFDRIRVAFAGVATDIPLGGGLLASFHLEGHHNQKAHGRKTTVSADEQAQFSKKFRKAKTGDKAQKATRRVGDSIPPEWQPGQGSMTLRPGQSVAAGYALSDYQTRSAAINGSLRRHESLHTAFPGESEDQHTAAHQFEAGMSHIMGRSSNSDDIVVERGISSPRGTFGSSWSNTESNVGLTWTDHGYSSTTTDHSIAKSFAHQMPSEDSIGHGRHPTVMRIFVPKGTRSFSVGDRGHDEFAREKEIVLDKGLKYRIMADHGVDQQSGVRLIDVQVLGPSDE